MAPVQSLEIQYRSAIALNNTAVSLLTRGHYHPAFHALKDAAAIVRKVCSLGGGGGDYENNNDVDKGEWMQMAMDRANKQIASVGIVDQTLSNSPLLLRISCEDSPSLVYQTLTSCIEDITSFDVGFPTTIDPVDSESCTGDDGFYFETSIILYNLGLAFRCVVVSTNDCDCQERANEKVHRLFTMAEAMVAYVVVQGNHYVQCRLLLFKTVLAHSLLNSSIALNSEMYFAKYSLAMQHQLQTIEKYQTILQLEVEGNASAA